MSQSNWVYSDQSGQQYEIGLYHGQSSGHLIVYCNWKVILIDFNVLNTKAYSFYFGEELCHLKINKTGERYDYSFNQSDETIIAIENQKKKLWRTDIFKAAAAFLLSLILIISAIYFL